MNAYHVKFGEQNSLVFLRVEAAPGALLGPLPPSQREIAELMVAGRSNAEIARQRGTSPRTVANQVAHIFDALQVSSRAQLARRVALGA
jgi:DNA-binding NarL/FixJ family response regulator